MQETSGIHSPKLGHGRAELDTVGILDNTQQVFIGIGVVVRKNGLGPHFINGHLAYMCGISQVFDR